MSWHISPHGLLNTYLKSGLALQGKSDSCIILSMAFYDVLKYSYEEHSIFVLTVFDVSLCVLEQGQVNHQQVERGYPRG